MEMLLLVIASFVAGFVDAVAGGGGVITFPTLLYAGLPISEIVGTTKLINTAGTTVAAITFFKRGTLNREIIKLALGFTVIGSLIGAATVLSIPNDFLKPCVSTLVICVALYCYLRPSLGVESRYQGLNAKTSLFVIAAALLIGFYDGFFGPGTGIFLTFFFIRVIGCDFLHATANTKVLNCVSNLVPLVYFLSKGNIRFDIGVPMLCANLLGGYLGARAAIAKGSGFIKWIYLVMAMLTALKLLIDLAR